MYCLIPLVITGENGASWRSFFNVVAQSNLTINNINKYAGEGVSPQLKKWQLLKQGL